MHTWLRKLECVNSVFVKQNRRATYVQLFAFLMVITEYHSGPSRARFYVRPAVGIRWDVQYSLM